MNADPKNNPANAAEEAEPTAGSVPVPVWLFMLLAALGWRGCLYMDEQGGGFSPLVYEPYPTVAYLKKVDDLTSSGGPGPGKKIYETYCIVCHQPNGMGSPNQFPPLAGSEWVLAQGPNRIIRVVLNGMQGPITIKGLTFPPTSAMPPWKDLLKDQEIADVLTYIRQNKEWGNNASPVTAAQVKAIRDAEKDRSSPWNPEELLKVPDHD